LKYVVLYLGGSNFRLICINFCYIFQKFVIYLWFANDLHSLVMTVCLISLLIRLWNLSRYSIIILTIGVFVFLLIVGDCTFRTILNVCYWWICLWGTFKCYVLLGTNWWDKWSTQDYQYQFCLCILILFYYLLFKRIEKHCQQINTTPNIN
jgi:hypothetical protein